MSNRAISVVSGAVFILVATDALAEDLAVKTPPSAPAYNWTGWYAGVNAGAGFDKTYFNGAPVTAVDTSRSLTGTLTAPSSINRQK